MFEKIIRPEGEPNALPEETKPPLTPDEELVNFLKNQVTGYNNMIKAYELLLTEIDKLTAEASNNNSKSTGLEEMKTKVLTEIQKTRATLQSRVRQLSQAEESMKTDNSPDSKT